MIKSDFYGARGGVGSDLRSTATSIHRDVNKRFYLETNLYLKSIGCQNSLIIWV